MKRYSLIIRLSTVMLPIFSMVCFTGCEGYMCAVGIVKDKVAGTPLDSVYVSLEYDSSRRTYTDTSGKYEICNRFGGCVVKCADIHVTFSKTGYYTVSEKNPRDISLEKQ